MAGSISPARAFTHIPDGWGSNGGSGGGSGAGGGGWANGAQQGLDGGGSSGLGGGGGGGAGGAASPYPGGGAGGAGNLTDGGTGGPTTGGSGFPGVDGDSSADHYPGGGGGGGAHGYSDITTVALPTSAATGGNGGNGGSGYSTGGGGGGGGGGAGASIPYVFAPGYGDLGTLGVALTGGNGGNGGAGSSGGNGGGGGLGFFVYTFPYPNAGNSSLSVSSVIHGGNGGHGGGDPGSGGAGGVGGAGIGVYSDGSGTMTLTLTSAAVVTGGNGGAAGATGGTYGAGGIGIVGSQLHLILDPGASVSGGLAGNGVDRGNAIVFTNDAGDDNSLQLLGNGGTSGQTYASIIGNVVAVSSGTDVLKLSGQGGVFNLQNMGSQFQNFATVSIDTTGTWITTGTTGVPEVGTPVWHVDAGTLQLGDNSTAATMYGAVTVNSGGTLSAGFLPSTVHGTITFNSGSTYLVHVAPGDEHSLITATGAVTLTGGNVMVTAVPGSYAPNATYTILSGSSVTGTFGGVTSDYAFLTPSLSYDAEDVFLTLVYTGVNFSAYAHTSNQVDVAGAAQALGIGNPVFDALMQLSAGAVPASLNQLTGEVYASAATVMQNQSFYLRDAVGKRLDQSLPAASATGALSYAAVKAGPQTARLSADWTPTLWMQGYGAWGNEFSNGNAATISSSIGGFFAGLDAEVAGTARAGLVAGFSKTNLDVTDRGSSGSIDNVDLGLYAGGQFGVVGLKGGVSYTWHDVSLGRSIVFPGFLGSTTSSYTQGTTQVFGEVNTMFAVSAFDVQPFADLAYVHLSGATFTEGGPSAAALTADVSSLDTVYGTLGLRVATSTKLAGRTLTPSATLGWQYAFNDTTPLSTMRFAGGAQPFSIEGVPIAQNAALLGAGLAYDLADNAKVSVNYVGQVASTTSNNAFTAQVSVKF